MTPTGPEDWRDFSHALWKSKLYTLSSWVLVLCVFVAGLVFAYRRKWFFLTRAAYDAHRTQKERR